MPPERGTTHYGLRQPLLEAGLVLAILTATAGVYLSLRISVPVPGTSIVWLLVAGGFTALSRLAVRVRDGRVQAWSWGLAAAFALLTVIGQKISGRAALEQLSVRSLCFALLVWIGLTVAFWLVLAPMYRLLLHTDLSARDARALWLSSGRKRWFALWGILLACWLPYYLLQFPGLVSTDSTSQLMQILGELPLSNHHPVAHTLLIGAFVKPAVAAGSLTWGVALYTAFQMAAMSAVFATACWYLGRRRVNPFISLAVLAYFALFPPNAALAATVWKDVPFAGVTLLLVILLVELARAPGRFLADWRCVAAFVALSFLFCVLRNNGLYAFAIAGVVLLIVLRTHWRRLIPALACVAVLVVAYNAVIYGALQAQPGESREALSVPIQQIARVAKVYGDSVTVAQRDRINQYLPYSQLASQYNPRLSDPVKKQFNDEAFSRDPLAFVGIWLELGAEFPRTYLDSFLSNSRGYWYPGSTRWVARYYGPEQGIKRGLDLQPSAPVADAAGNLLSDFENEARQLPLVSLLFSPATSAWLLAAAAVLLVLKRRRRDLLPFALLAALWLTTLASPVSGEYRYLYGVIVSAPVIAALALARQRVERPEGE